MHALSSIFMMCKIETVHSIHVPPVSTLLQRSSSGDNCKHFTLLGKSHSKVSGLKRVPGAQTWTRPRPFQQLRNCLQSGRYTNCPVAPGGHLVPPLQSTPYKAVHLQMFQNVNI
jgi:hypothetical protein